MTRRTTIGLLAAMTAIAPAALSACGGGGGGGGGSTASTSGGTAAVTLPTTASGKKATVGVASVAGLGKILVDSTGHTLYQFQQDTGTKSTCTGGCAAGWPPLRATATPVAGTSLTASKLSTTPRTDGSPQVTYNGHPLYVYSADQNPGDANGQGVNAFGALWYVLSPAGDTVTTKSSSTNPNLGY